MNNGFKWWGWNVPCYGCQKLTDDQTFKNWECKQYNRVIAYIDYNEDTERLTEFGETKYHKECEGRL